MLIGPIDFPGTPEGQISFSAEAYGGTAAVKEAAMMTVAGSARLYQASSSAWSEPRIGRLHLLGKRLRFSVDLSRVECSCNAAVYLVNMRTASYCDANTAPSCTELDLLEANLHAMQTAVHTTTGTGRDGTCNQEGALPVSEAALRLQALGLALSLALADESTPSRRLK